MNADPLSGAERFWHAARHLLETPGVTRSTMMGFPCLRLEGEFFASWDPHQDALVVKLDRVGVDAMLAAGTAEPFAPNGRRFREWASIPAAAGERWSQVLDDAFDHTLRRRGRIGGV